MIDLAKIDRAGLTDSDYHSQVNYQRLILLILLHYQNMHTSEQMLHFFDHDMDGYFTRPWDELRDRVDNAAESYSIRKDMWDECWGPGEIVREIRREFNPTTSQYITVWDSALTFEACKAIQRLAGMPYLCKHIAICVVVTGLTLLRWHLFSYQDCHTIPRLWYVAVG